MRFTRVILIALAMLLVGVTAFADEPIVPNPWEWTGDSISDEPIVPNPWNWEGD